MALGRGAQHVVLTEALLGVVVCGVASVAGVVGTEREAFAQTVRFEPTDLDFVDPGQLELDTQVGFASTDGPSRLVLPDLEANLGILPHVELDLDTQFGIEGRDEGAFRADHVYRENLWPAAKLALLDRHDAGRRHGFGVGVQLGPKVPLARGARGAGYEGVSLLGVTADRAHAVLNLGGFVDPGREVARGRPLAFEGGLDLVYELGPARAFSLVGEVGGIRFFRDGDDEVHVSLGVAWKASEALELSLVEAHGFFAGDRDAILLGVSPKVDLW